MDDASLFRYTNFASLIDLLVKRKISLLDPGKWTDRNDSAFIKLYGSSLGFKSLYAICFTSSVETSHHWHAFAPGTDGVRIEFDKYGLIECLENDKNSIDHGKVKYKTLKEVESQNFELGEMPFIKRYAFRGEDEYRVFYASKRLLKSKIYEIKLDLSCIKKITINNNLPKELADPLKKLICSIDGCETISVSRSTLNYNNRWVTAGVKKSQVLSI